MRPSAARLRNFTFATMGNVIVLGSLNRDCIAQVEALPPPGHTVVAKQLLYRFGGKGGNQAVAAAKQDADVFMIGCVGDDSAGQAYVQMLKEHGINTEGVVKRAGTPTGMAMISVDAQAENTIVVCLAANDTLTADEVVAQQPAIARGTMMLAQFEVPIDAVVAGLKLARQMGTTTCLNPSPWRENFPWGEFEIDFVIVNEHEAAQLCGRPVLSLGEIGWIRDRMRGLGIHTLIVTRGADSTLAFSNVGPSFEVPSILVQPVDTVGAGDCFAGVFAARWSEDKILEMALRAACVAGSLSTLKTGAQEATPDRNKVDEALADALMEQMRR